MKSDKQLSPRVRKKRQAKRAELLQRAIAICLEDGLEALTLHSLARSVNKTPGALYRYFASKSQLLDEVHRHLLDQLLDYFQTKLDSRCQELAQQISVDGDLLKLYAISHLYADLIDLSPEVIKLLAVFSTDQKVLIHETGEQAFQSALRDLLLFVADPIEKAIAAGLLEQDELNSPLDRAVILWASLQGLLVVEKLARVPFLAVRFKPSARAVASALIESWKVKTS